MGAIVNDILIPSDTLQSIENINYFTYHDVNLTGDDDNNRLSSGSGDDTIYGGAGDDTLINGSGNDFIYGQDGDDIFYNWSGTDYYDGGQGNDTIISDFSSNEIEGIIEPQSFEFYLNLNTGIHGLPEWTTAEDTVINVENYTLIGDFNAELIGDFKDNILSTDLGNDTIYGGLGNDTINSGSGDDIIDGGADDDTIYEVLVMT